MGDTDWEKGKPRRYDKVIVIVELASTSGCLSMSMEMISMRVYSSRIHVAIQ